MAEESGSQLSISERRELEVGDNSVVSGPTGLGSYKSACLLLHNRNPCLEPSNLQIRSTSCVIGIKRRSL